MLQSGQPIYQALFIFVVPIKGAECRSKNQWEIAQEYCNESVKHFIQFIAEVSESYTVNVYISCFSNYKHYKSQQMDRHNMSHTWSTQAKVMTSKCHCYSRSHLPLTQGTTTVIKTSFLSAHSQALDNLYSAALKQLDGVLLVSWNPGF